MSQLTIGLFGFGTVGEGLYRVLRQKPTLAATIKTVCIKHPEKPRAAPSEIFTTEAAHILEDPEINVVIELIDDADAAYGIITEALRRGKAVVSANKKCIAEHLPALLELQRQTGTSFLYEGACAASIPVLRNLEEYYDNDLLQGLRGIVNGSTNYILSKVEDGLSYRQGLFEAQAAGFAESDPRLDVEGHDAASKLVILLAHAYGIVAKPTELVYRGITALHPADARWAREKGYRIRLVATAKKLKRGSVAAFVLPQAVTPDDPLFGVRGEYNGVVIESGLADAQAFIGKGAGAFPTSSAVLSDLSALRYNYRYEYKKLRHGAPARLTDDFLLRAYISYPRLRDVPQEVFERIEEWHSTPERCHVVVRIRFADVRSGAWWTEGSSIIALPDAVCDVKPEATRVGKSRLLEEVFA